MSGEEVDGKGWTLGDVGKLRHCQGSKPVMHCRIDCHSRLLVKNDYLEKAPRERMNSNATLVPGTDFRKVQTTGESVFTFRC